MDIVNNKIRVMVIIIVGIVGTMYAKTITDPMKKECKCTLGYLDTVFLEISERVSSFRDAYEIINLQYCNVDTATIRKYTVKLLHLEDIDSTFSMHTKSVYHAVERIALDDNVWNNDIENIVAHRMVMAKKKNINSYYGYASTLVRLSSNWYYYAMDVYKTKSTEASFERNWVFQVIIERFKDSKNPAEKQKVESLIYAVLNFDTYFIEIFDNYLQHASSNYKNSFNRKKICDEFEDRYKNYANHDGMKAIFRYVKNVKKYMSTLGSLTDYTPPLKIE